MMNLNAKKGGKKQITSAMLMFMVLVMLFNVGAVTAPATNTAEAATSGNLVKSGSFEDDTNIYWRIWDNNANTNRQYEFFRSYEAPFGEGSYSGAIEATGPAGDQFSAGLLSDEIKNSFTVEAGKNYFLIYHAKATTDMSVFSYLERADTFDSITGPTEQFITTEWQKFMINITPTLTSSAILSIVYGGMPSGATFYIDGVQVVESNSILNTTEVKGYIGDVKSLRLTNLNNFEESDIEIELPYYDPEIGDTVLKRFMPGSMDSSNVYFNMPKGSFAGIGRVYVYNEIAGEFTYNVIPKIDDLHPSMLRADEDIVITGSGFIPYDGSTQIVLKAINNENKSYDAWIKPHAHDSKLSLIAAKLPMGIISGSVYVRTAFTGAGDKLVESKSNSIGYKVKPVIFGVEWRERGYEHVGDTLVVYGKGISQSPSVNFYDFEGNKIESLRAKTINISDTEETIEVQATKKANIYDITVNSGGIESDVTKPLSYSSKPRFTAIQSKYSRNISSNSTKMQAAKIGEEITLRGEGFIANTDPVRVEFEGTWDRTLVDIAPETVATDGRSFKVIVPEGTQNGYLCVIVNGERSNYLPMEIVPTVLETSPNPALPGQVLKIVANGVNNNLELTKVYFKFGNGQEVMVHPYLTNLNGNLAEVHVVAPLSLSSEYTTVSLQYDKWMADGTAVINVSPHVESAHINMDTKILTIRGYGFSIHPDENKITYKYADEDKTVVNPATRLLGIYPTEDGQEIRVQILDDYHYGIVSVTVGSLTSNEVNFGPVSVSSVARRVEHVENIGVTGVLYINGYNFGPEGGVLVGSHWADVHYRSDFFIIAVIDEAFLYENPVIVARE